MNVGQRIRQARKAQGLKQNQLAELAGCKQADIHRIESGQVSHSKYLATLLKILHLQEDTQAKIPVVGYVGAGAEVFAIDDHVKGDGFDEIDAPPGMLNGIALIVRGDSMSPKYEDGEIIYIEKTLYSLDSLLGQICYVQLADGRSFLKRLNAGTRPGTFNLISLNAAPIIDVVVERAYPIAFTKPKYKNLK